MATSNIGALNVKITSDTSGLDDGVKKSKSGLQSIGNTATQSAAKVAKWGSVAVAAATAVGVAMVKANLDSIDALAKTADKLGVTTEALQGLQHAAELTGVSVTTMETSLQRMTRRVSEAAQGTGVAVAALEELGIAVEDIANLSADEQLLVIADAMEGVTNQSDRLRLSVALFDTEGAAMINTLNGGSEALKGMMDEVNELGFAINRIDAAKIEQANDAFLRAGKMATAFGQQLTVAVSPTLTAVINQIIEMDKETNVLGVTAERVFNGIVTAVGVAADAYRGWQIIIEGIKIASFGLAMVTSDVMLSVTRAIDSMIDTAKSGINTLISAANAIPGIDIEQLVVGGESAATTFFRDVAESSEASMRQAQQAIHELAMRPLPSDSIQQFVAEANAAAEEAARLATETNVNVPDFTPNAGATSTGEGEEKSSAIFTYEQETIGLLEAMGMRFLSQEEAQLAANQRQQELLEQQYQQGLLSQEQYNEQSVRLTRQAEEAKRQITVNNLEAGFQALASNSKKVNKAMQAVAIYQATIKGKQAAVDAWQAGMSTGGPFAPIKAAAYAAASIANTASMINSIKSGGSISSSGSSSSVATGGGSSSTSGESTTSEQSVGKNVSISLVGGSSFSADQVRELIGQINEAVGDGLELNVNGA